MSSTKNERLRALLTTFKLANQARWSVGSTSPENKALLKNAAEKAEEAYIDAVNLGLKTNGTAVEVAYKAVNEANKVILLQLKKRAKILKRIEAIDEALSKGLKLIEKAAE